MKKISKEEFVLQQPNPDKVIAFRIETSQIYFLGWMEDAENYKIQMAQSSTGYLLKDGFKNSIYDAITSVDEYNHMNVYDFKKNEEFCKEHSFENAHDMFASFIEDAHIAITTEQELLRNEANLVDGKYIFIIGDEAK